MQAITHNKTNFFLVNSYSEKISSEIKMTIIKNIAKLILPSFARRNRIEKTNDIRNIIMLKTVLWRFLTSNKLEKLVIITNLAECLKKARRLST